MASSDLFAEAESPARRFERDAARRALDDLFVNARKYKSSAAYMELLRFIVRFRTYSPFNALLIHAQMPGARFVAPAYRWLRDYSREIKPDARTIVILRPRGPVMFVFDVSDTEPRPNAPPLPRKVTDPFGVVNGKVGKEPDRMIGNARRDGVRTVEATLAARRGGSIAVAPNGGKLDLAVGAGSNARTILVDHHYDLLLNDRMSAEGRFRVLVHELAHLYCGHLGSPNQGWWPDRRGLGRNENEFEAESVSYLVCGRLGITSPAEEYLSGYLKENDDIPAISFDRVWNALTLIEQMGDRQLPPRKTDAE